MSKTPRSTKCDVCDGMLKKTYKALDVFHACSSCHNFIGKTEEKAKQIFWE